MKIALWLLGYVMVGVALACFVEYTEPSKEHEDMGWLFGLGSAWPLALPFLLACMVVEYAHDKGVERKAREMVREAAKAKQEAEIDQIIKEEAL